MHKRKYGYPSNDTNKWVDYLLWNEIYGELEIFTKSYFNQLANDLSTGKMLSVTVQGNILIEAQFKKVTKPFQCYFNLENYVTPHYLSATVQFIPNNIECISEPPPIEYSPTRHDQNESTYVPTASKRETTMTTTTTQQQRRGNSKTKYIPTPKNCKRKTPVTPEYIPIGNQDQETETVVYTPMKIAKINVVTSTHNNNNKRESSSSSSLIDEEKIIKRRDRKKKQKLSEALFETDPIIVTDNELSSQAQRQTRRTRNSLSDGGNENYQSPTISSR